MSVAEEITLADGRTMAYYRFGDAAGEVVLNCHGGLVSGLDVGLSDAAAQASGISIISPNRPGIGRSSRKAGHGILSWAQTDLVELIDRLEIERFTVMGWSEGGQYALAAAYALPSRVERAAVIAGALPLDDPQIFGELNATDRRLSSLSRRLPLLARGYFVTSRMLAGASPRVVARVAARTMTRVDAEIVEENHEWFAQCVVDAALDAAGAVDEYAAFVAPWGFELEQISVPVDIYQGGVDNLVPPSWARTMLSRLPSATLHEYPDEGHFIAVTRRPEVLRGLVAPV
ncbi:alpha/beta hydrolase [Subtercola endophyticus]|uniref:alpha/beta hydrolase n=1 Tax=Subtercola endophyticus TaxID=2895559 RepID=UPI001E556D11|nr:alpha/beta hydrolase [Subtercola endophyticus]UFS60801.1 alpha/beta hydrolase [Subtercola endophyticus]